MALSKVRAFSASDAALPVSLLADSHLVCSKFMYRIGAQTSTI